jgi:hypothetical protein
MESRAPPLGLKSLPPSPSYTSQILLFFPRVYLIGPYCNSLLIIEPTEPQPWRRRILTRSGGVSWPPDGLPRVST